MKKLVVGVVVGVVIGVVAARWLHAPAAPAPAPAGETAAKAEEKKDNPLHVPPAKRTAAGITLGAPEAVTLAPEVAAYGRVLDPTPYAALVAEAASAQASLAASEKEYERVQKLFAAGGNASAQAVETAQAAALRDRAAVDSAQVRLLAGWGEALARTADLNALRQMLAQGTSLIRVDLPAGITPAKAPDRATVSLLGGSETFSVKLLGPAPVADPQVQGASFIGILHERSLPAGAALQVTVPGPGEPAAALVLPRTAIVYHQGSAWVYVLGEEDTFERKLVTLGRSRGEKVVISSGVESGDQVVITGAQQLLSAELQTGDSGDEG